MKTFETCRYRVECNWKFHRCFFSLDKGDYSNQNQDNNLLRKKSQIWCWGREVNNSIKEWLDSSKQNSFIIFPVYYSFPSLDSFECAILIIWTMRRPIKIFLQISGEAGHTNVFAKLSSQIWFYVFKQRTSTETIPILFSTKLMTLKNDAPVSSYKALRLLNGIDDDAADMNKIYRSKESRRIRSKRKRILIKLTTSRKFEDLLPKKYSIWEVAKRILFFPKNM